MQENIRSKPVKKAMYKEINGKLIIIAKTEKGLPVILEEKI